MLGLIKRCGFLPDTPQLADRARARGQVLVPPSERQHHRARACGHLLLGPRGVRLGPVSSRTGGPSGRRRRTDRDTQSIVTEVRVGTVFRRVPGGAGNRGRRTGRGRKHGFHIFVRGLEG